MGNVNMTIQLYGIPNCATVKKARAWLDAHQIPHLFRDFKKDPPAEAEIRPSSKPKPTAKTAQSH